MEQILDADGSTDRLLDHCALFGIRVLQYVAAGHSSTDSAWLACFRTGISTPVPLPSHVTSRRFWSGWLVSGSTSAQPRPGWLGAVAQKSSLFQTVKF
jgi:hypothetical protein